MATSWTTTSATAVAIGLSLPFFIALRQFSQAPRSGKIKKIEERVLVIGASSGIGREIAKTYAIRGARLCVIGRREGELAAVKEECETLEDGAARGEKAAEKVLSVTADFTSADDMVRVRDSLEKAWGGLDTLIVCAGVSAVQSLMALTDSDNANSPSAQGVQRAADIASAAIRGNYTGPLISAVTMIPTLERSCSPSILLISSIGAIIPAPTRTLYGSTKSASLLLYQALSIEHPRIKFNYILPSTVQGSFRASAVDGGPIRQADPILHGLRKEDVARRAVRALDAGEGTVFYPWWYRWVHLLYLAWPGIVEWGARRKYKFK